MKQTDKMGYLPTQTAGLKSANELGHLDNTFGIPRSLIYCEAKEHIICIHACSVNAEINCNWVQAHPPQTEDGVCSALLISTHWWNSIRIPEIPKRLIKYTLVATQDMLENGKIKVLICKLSKNTGRLRKGKCPGLPKLMGAGPPDRKPVSIQWLPRPYVQQAQNFLSSTEQCLLTDTPALHLNGSDAAIFHWKLTDYSHNPLPPIGNEWFKSSAVPYSDQWPHSGLEMWLSPSCHVLEEYNTHRVSKTRDTPENVA